jgi:hypothetical protein
MRVWPSTDVLDAAALDHWVMIRQALALLSAVALSAAFALTPAARADTLIQPLSGAHNLTAAATGTTVAPGGQILRSAGWLAWAQPSGGGRWRLGVRSPQGATTTPDIPDFGAAPDPSIGSDYLGTTGRTHLFVVYSRCSGTSAIAGCDVYRYDLVAGTEEKVAAISTAAASETAPSVRVGLWSFVRRGSGASHPGVYVHTPNGGTRRLSSVLARETAMSVSRVAYAYNSSNGGGVAIRRLSGDGGVVNATTHQAAVPSSLVATRYKYGWLMPAGDTGVSFRWTSRLSGRATTVTVRSGKRDLPASTNSITTDDRVPDKYLDQAGISTLGPPLV